MTFALQIQLLGTFGDYQAVTLRRPDCNKLRFDPSTLSSQQEENEIKRLQQHKFQHKWPQVSYSRKFRITIMH